MASYRIKITPAAEADFLAVPFPMRRQLNQAIFKLKDRPRPENSEEVAGVVWQAVVHGYAIIYEIDEAASVVTVFRIAH